MGQGTGDLRSAEWPGRETLPQQAARPFREGDRKWCQFFFLPEKRTPDRKWCQFFFLPEKRTPGRSGWFPTQTPHRSVLARLTHTAPRFKLRRRRYPSSFRGHVHGFRCTRDVSLQRSLETASPSLHGVLRSSSPDFVATLGRSDSRPPVSPHFVAFGWRYRRFVPSSSPPARDRSGDQPGVGQPGLRPAATTEVAGSLRFPSDPHVPAPCSWTPVGPKTPSHCGARRGPRLCQQRWLPRATISGLNRTASGLAVYASQWRSPATTPDSLPAAG